MIAWLVAIVTVILIAIIIARRVSPQFRQRSELPKHLFLTNLGIKQDSPSGSTEAGAHHLTSSVDPKGEEHSESHES